MNKEKIVKNSVVCIFVLLYTLVSLISTVHVVDFFELSNPRWMAITLAIGFEIGAAASLASLVILDKMNKTIVWSLFIAITAMQMNGNLYYAFINLDNYSAWSELFDLVEQDPLYQKRILAFVSGAILPLIALGFIKSLVDYIKPEGNIKEEDIKPLVFEHPDWNGIDEHWDGSSEDAELWEGPIGTDGPDDSTLNEVELDSMDDDLDTMDNELDDMWEDLNAIGELHSTDDKTDTPGYALEDKITYGYELEEEWDEDHAHEVVINNWITGLSEDDLLEIDADDYTEPNFTENDVKVIFDANENPTQPTPSLIKEVENYKEIVKPKEPIKDVDASYEFGKNLYNTMMSKINTDHLPKDKDLKPNVSTEESTKTYNNLGLVNQKKNPNS
jgi:hypothetical protein